MKINLNNAVHEIPAEWIDRSLLSLINDYFSLVGAKFGCGVGQCGACAVLVDGEPTRSCLETARNVEGTEIVTLEGLVGDPVGDRVTRAWVENAVAQCGYCQAGQIIGAVGLLKRNSAPSREDIDAAMEDTLCRCGTYARVRRSIEQAAGDVS